MMIKISLYFFKGLYAVLDELEYLLLQIQF